MKPLWECAAKLTHPKMPAWQRCASLVFPAWTKKRVITWNPSERVIPSMLPDTDARDYVSEFDKLNKLKSACVFGVEIRP